MSAPDDRVDPPLAGGEAETLQGYLTWLRDTLRRKTGGLDAQQLDTRLPPSTMTLGGLLKHLAWVESWWFVEVFGDRTPAEPWASADFARDRDWEWHTAVHDSPEELRRLFDEAVAESDRVLAEAMRRPEGLDAVARRGAHDPRRRVSLRWILVHMVEEHARHLGHADLLREAVDGTTGQ